MQDRVNQVESEQEKVSGMKKGADSRDKVNLNLLEAVYLRVRKILIHRVTVQYLKTFTKFLKFLLLCIVCFIGIAFKVFELIVGLKNLCRRRRKVA